MPLTRQQLLWGALTVFGALLLVVIVQANLQGVSFQLLAWQRDLHRTLTLAITELSRTPSTNTWLTLLGVSFAYGVFHAAGPGHGKAVLATYLASHGGATRRALGLSFAASLLQGVTAIAMVAVLVHGLGWLTRQAMGSVVWVEQASFMLVALLGGWLCWRAIKQLRQAYSAHASDAVDHSHSHSHSHSHDHSHCCGGAHHIEPQQALDWRTALMTVGAIGMRPCTGAVLMLGAASLLGQFYVGVASVLAMSLGTGITVSVLALASIVARGWATKRLQRQSSRQMVEKAAGWAALAGGALIVALGVSLSLAGAAQPASGPLLNEPPSRQGSLLGK
ncbi:nickel/cobalt transporter [Halomonas sp. TD01]|uniref:nickel/cobalt transporter n=1 Tax=Halomonas sp. TD01 TaxID=999141 RepID=UPI000214FA1D|nr:nickel/cobalt transporter [Halomonas sp. TD01]EGP18109.1 nickel/cobalt exporter [Halomonas sp. TD01]CAH1043338.1 putative membrane protein [Halomonas sp. TD01]